MITREDNIIKARIAYFDMLIANIMTSGLSGGEIVHMLSRLRSIRSELKRYENTADETR